MNIEDITRTSLDELAAAARPPVPDPAAIRRSARRGTRIRAGVTVGLAAAVTAAVIIGAGVVRDNQGAPQPANPSPTKGSGTSAVAGAVWYADGVLHDGTHDYSIAGTITSNLAPTSTGVAYGVDGGDVMYQPRTGDAYRIGQHALLGPVADPTSSLVAWFEGTGRNTKLVVYSVEVAQEVQRADIYDLTVASPEAMVGRAQPPITWVGQNERGGITVFFAAGGHLWQYATTDAGPGDLAQVTGGGVDATRDILAQARPHVEQGSMRFVRADTGDVISQFTPLEPDGGLSHDGAFYAGYSRGALVQVDIESGVATKAELDRAVIPFGVTFSRDAVMFFAPTLGGGTRGDIYSCPLDTFRCQVVGHADDVYEAVLPAF